jgi:hypothetical protein
MSLQTAVLHKAGVGALSVALDEPAASQGPLSPRSLLAQPLDRPSTLTALEAAHLKNLHIGLTSFINHQKCSVWAAGRGLLPADEVRERHRDRSVPVDGARPCR